MYKMTFNGHTIYDPRLEDRVIWDPSVHLAVGEPGSVSFNIAKNHPAAGTLTKLSGVLTLDEDGYVLYKGRVVRDTKDLDNSRNVETEGLLACLNDSVIRPFHFPEDLSEEPSYQEAAATGNVVAYFLGWMLDQHNQQVGPDARVRLGEVTVTDPNNYISRSNSDYLTTWEAINTRLAGSSLGGQFVVEYTATETILHYYDTLPYLNTQRIEFAENLLDLSSEVDATGVYTGILPVGKDCLTIAELPDGELSPGILKDGDVIRNTALERAYNGRITRVVSWPDVTDPSNLRRKAANTLTSVGASLRSNITVKACDLHCSDATIASFRVGRMIDLSSGPHDLVDRYPLLELDIDILDPGNTSITLSAVSMSQTDRNKVVEYQQTAKMEDQQQRIDTVAETTTQQLSDIAQTSSEIVIRQMGSYVERTDFDEYKSSQSASLQVLSDELRINVERSEETIEQLEGSIKAKFDEFKKYFSFTEDGLLIGAEGNQIMLRLDNDLLAFLRNGYPALKMDENGLEATSLKTNQITIGSYSLIGENDGRISLRKTK